MYSLEKLEQFVALLHEVERTKRTARRPHEQEMMNTAEHTFELAMVCWYIAASHKLDLDLGLILKYALAHDIVEGYAGDTYIYDEEARKTKAEREQKALLRIEAEFPEFPELIAILREYEKRKDDESKLVYAADKLIDPLDSSMDTESSIWKEFNVSTKQLHAYKDHKIAESPHVFPYWQMLTKKLDSKKEFFFHE